MAVEALLARSVSAGFGQQLSIDGCPCGAVRFRARRAGPLPARAVSLTGVAALAASFLLLVHNSVASVTSGAPARGKKRKAAISSALGDKQDGREAHV